MSDAELPLIVEPAALEAARGADRLVVVDLNDAATYASGHVPGAVNLAYPSLIGPRPPAMGLIAAPEALGAALAACGLTPDSHVVAYDSEGNAKAARLLWTLDAIGHGRFSLLDGGLVAWAGEGHALERGMRQPAPGDYPVDGIGRARAEKDEILARLGDPELVILDVRTPAEYAGEDVRAARGGHIPGAVNWDWTLAIDRGRNLRLRPADELRTALAARGVTPDKEVVAHCHTHHRSSHTYIVLKSLGFSRIRGYDGSWSEWGNDPRTPIES